MISEGGMIPVPRLLEFVSIETFVAHYRIQKTPRIAALLQERDSAHLRPPGGQEWPEDFRQPAPRMQGIA